MVRERGQAMLPGMEGWVDADLRGISIVIVVALIRCLLRRLIGTRRRGRSVAGLRRCRDGGWRSAGSATKGCQCGRGQDRDNGGSCEQDENCGFHGGSSLIG